MSEWSEDPFDRYFVVVNDEEQHSIWPAVKQVPAGWIPSGFEGSRVECLAHIERVWTDIRPRSLRLRLAEHETSA
ncbi:MbtH family protein [Actinosynnema sp. NPDC050801]|uniref:MbtH family protein n=1 Tax=unclassified Actinosynnema TaxID=2637065 RepID=UPI0033C71CF1